MFVLPCIVVITEE